MDQMLSWVLFRIVCTNQWDTLRVLRFLGKCISSSLRPVAEFLSIDDAFCNSPVSGFDPSLINCPGQAAACNNKELHCFTLAVLVEYGKNVENTFLGASQIDGRGVGCTSRVVFYTTLAVERGEE